MRHTLLSLLATAATLGAAAQTRLPDVTLQTLAGEAVQLAEVTAGRPTVIAFWASWCAPCKQELAAYSTDYAAWRDDLGAEVIAVTIDNPRGLKKVGPMVEAKGWTFPVLADPNSALPAALGFQTIPQVYVVDGDGTIVYEHSGYTPGDEAHIAEILAGLAN